MADGASPRALVEARNRVEIKRLEYMIEQGELEVMELLNQVEMKKENVKASREAMKKAEANIAALANDNEEVNDG
jgi:hypothetical protein